MYVLTYEQIEHYEGSVTLVVGVFSHPEMAVDLIPLDALPDEDLPLTWVRINKRYVEEWVLHSRQLDFQDPSYLE